MILFLLMLACFTSSSFCFTRLLLTMIGVHPNNYVVVGSHVIICCEPYGIGEVKRQPLVFKRNDRIISERCDSFEDRFQLECRPQGWKAAKFFCLNITRVEWQDRGSWLCALGENITTINVQVYSPPKHLDLSIGVEDSMNMEYPLDVHNGKKFEKRADYLSSSSATFDSLARNSAVDAKLLHRFISFSYDSGDDYVGKRLPPGSGTAMRPLDLRPLVRNDTYAIRITCNTSCSYPATNFVWTIRNKTENEIIFDVEHSTIYHSFRSSIGTKHCDSNENTKDMYTNKEDWYLNCSSLPLSGTIHITCRPNISQFFMEETSMPNARENGTITVAATTGHQYPTSHDQILYFKRDPSQTVSVICPGSGLSLHLLQAELLAITLAVVLAFMLATCFITVLLRNRKSIDPHTCHGYTYVQEPMQ